MIRLIFTIFLLFSANCSAIAALYPGSNSSWLVVASRSNLSDAINLAQQFRNTSSGASVFKSNNGWYAVSLGWSSQSNGKRILADLKQRNIVPHDSYFHSGERFIELMWSASGVAGRNKNNILRATRLSVVVASQPKINFNFNGPGYVSGLSGESDSFLSFRTGPSRSNREINRLIEKTTLQIIGELKGWYNIRLSSGQTGWVYGRFVSLGFPRQQVVETPPPAVPEPDPKPEIIISDADNGLKLKVSNVNKQAGGYASLRKGPGSEHLEIARLRENTDLTVTGKYKNWYRVSPAPSVQGWVKSEFLVASELPTFGPPAPETNSEEADTDKPEIETASNDPATDETSQPTQPMGKRVALVLGNSAYKHTTELPNPKNDADRISEKLKSLGFTVIVGLDGTKQEMELSIRKFVQELTNSEAALFFYAGHAMQVNGNNYLIPIDAKLEDSTAIDFETIQLSSILRFVDKPGRVSIALLDACRDNPLSRRFARSFGATRSAFIGRGLATPSSTGNLLIGFATAPGEVALDGKGENSPFTTALLKHMGTPKLEIEAMLKRVRSDVFTLTEEQQSPWVNSGLRKNFFLQN